MDYVYYLLAVCYYEQIVDETKDLQSIIEAQRYFNLVINKYPNTEYALDADFKLGLIDDILAAKEMYIGRYYLEKKKWVSAINRFRNVVDDFDMGVNFIIRGDDHLNNVFRQNLIYKAMAWEVPQYAHIPLIHGNDGKKLSKRHGAISINDFRNEGYLKESIINNLILLGWSPNKIEKDEFIQIDEIIKSFDISKISKSSSIFSYEKLNFFNNHYIKSNDNSKYLIKYCENNKNLNIFIKNDKDKFFKIFEVYKKNLNFYKELENIAKIYF